MASSSSDYLDALWEAARDTDIPDAKDKVCWPMLMMSLKHAKVDLTTRKPKEWLKSFEELQRLLRTEETGATAERLWEAARDTDIPDAQDETCWPMLMMSLKHGKVDSTTRKPKEWLKLFDELRKFLRREEKGATAERSSSTESERKSDVGSPPDSGYDSSSPRDSSDQMVLVPRPIYALVTPSEDCEDGKQPLWSCHSDKTDEDYIIETIFERLNLKRGRDGKVIVTWVPQEGGRTKRTKCAVLPDNEGLADMVFTTRTVEEKKEPGSKRQFLEERESRDTSRSRDASGRPQQIDGHPKRPELEKTLAYLFEKSSVRGLDDQEVTNLGRQIQLALRGAKTAESADDP